MLLSSYVYIPVSNMDKSAEWYEKNLGFKVTLKDELYYELSTENGIRIMLLPDTEHINSQMKFSDGEQPSYGFMVDNIDEIREKMFDSGIKVGEMFDYCGRSFSFYDLDGNKIELWQV
ncbi:MAG: VOC family protein [Oscillospiraceae bacterium]|nr:VOC family protein [Oscillospiraceae bacterium]